MTFQEEVLKKERLEYLLEQFRGKSLLVVGDLMLDEFLWGRVSRISPEAPVPVVEVQRESFYPGGAANVARNLSPFAAKVGVMGRIGTDAAGDRLKELFGQEGLSTEYLLAHSELPTTVKTRIIARNQQVVRVDREKKQTLSTTETRAAMGLFQANLSKFDAVIVEDYGKGFVQQSLLDGLVEAGQGGKLILTADPHLHNQLAWRGFTAVKPNRLEAFAAAGLAWSEPVDPPESDPGLLEAGRILMQDWDPELLLITLGEQGMQLFDRDGALHHTPTRAREVFDVSGAGDTAIALFTLALCSGATPLEAAEISNHASGVVVGKLGTAVLSPQELRESFELHHGP